MLLSDCFASFCCSVVCFVFCFVTQLSRSVILLPLFYHSFVLLLRILATRFFASSFCCIVVPSLQCRHSVTLSRSDVSVIAPSLHCYVLPSFICLILLFCRSVITKKRDKICMARIEFHSRLLVIKVSLYGGNTMVCLLDSAHQDLIIVVAQK